MLLHYLLNDQEICLFTYYQTLFKKFRKQSSILQRALDPILAFKVEKTDKRLHACCISKKSDATKVLFLAVPRRNVSPERESSCDYRFVEFGSKCLSIIEELRSLRRSSDDFLLLHAFIKMFDEIGYTIPSLQQKKAHKHAPVQHLTRFQ